MHKRYKDPYEKVITAPIKYTFHFVLRQMDQFALFKMLVKIYCSASLGIADAQLITRSQKRQ